MVAGSVLVIDDNAANLRLAGFLLRQHGFEVHTAMSATDALVCLSGVRPDIVLMDLQLPGVDGLTLTRQLREDPSTRQLCIVAMTAYAMPGDEDRARQAGCDGYLTKPIDPQSFATAVATYVKRATAAAG